MLVFIIESHLQQLFLYYSKLIFNFQKDSKTKSLKLLNF